MQRDIEVVRRDVMPGRASQLDADCLAASAVVELDAASDARPKLRYPAGKLARRVSKARRYAPAAVFDKQIRTLNRLAG